MTHLFSAENLITLLTLTAMELVLGIDNIVFISLLTGKLPRTQQNRARRIGLFMAMFMRVGLLLAIAWVMRLTRPLFHVLERGVSGRDLILIGGGLFLIGKSTHEIYERIEVDPDEPGEEHGKTPSVRGMWAAIGQIMVLDIVFSLDSVITAVGMAQEVPIMVAAIIVAVIVMMFFARAVGDFVNHHPSMKVLALSFLLLIGVMLVADGMGRHISKGYIYFAMAFSLLVEVINMRVRRSQKKARQLARAREAHFEANAPERP